MYWNIVNYCKKNSFLTYINNLWLKRKRLILSILFLLIVISILAFPYTKWFFYFEDFPVIFRAQNFDFKDFFIIDHNKMSVMGGAPSNYVTLEQSFCYRPLVFVFYKLLYLFFKTNAYSYFFVIILLHAFNSVFIFNIFLYFFNYLLAFLGTLFFAFHPSFINWMGARGALDVYITLLFFLIIVYLLKKYLIQKENFYYLFACLIFLISLFMYELIIVLPFWLFLAFYFYDIYKGDYKIFSLRSIKKSFYRSSGFWLILFSFLACRIYLFPVARLKLNPIILITNLKYRFFDVLNFVVDLFGLTFLPGGNRFLKGGIIVFLFSLLVWFFIKNKQKKYIVFFLLSILFFMWPFIMRAYRSWYLYIVLPFFTLALLFLINSYQSNSLTFKKIFKLISIIILFIVICLNTIRLCKNFKKRENLYNKIHLAINDLAYNKKINGRALCFIGIPEVIDPFTAITGIWLKGVNKNLPIYFEIRSTICGDISNKIDCLKIIPIQNGIRLILKDYDNIYFPSFVVVNCKMGKMKINKMINDEIIDVSFIFDKKYLKEDLLLVTWDFESFKFKTLDDILIDKVR